MTYGATRRYYLAHEDEQGAAGDYFTEPIPMHRVGSWRAGVGVKALARLSAHLTRAAQRSREIVAALSTVPNLKVHQPRANERPSATFIFVTLPSVVSCRKALSALWGSRYGVSKLFTRAIGQYPYLAGLLDPSDTPNAADLAARTLTITTSPSLLNFELDSIVSSLRASTP
jgi:dTDP-4-amino-4,6-dideoxygalactose transaminase